jgi:hypothetical protein
LPDRLSFASLQCSKAEVGMILSAFLLLLQAVPEQQAAPVVESSEEAVSSTEAPEAAAPKMKKVCRIEIDSRTGPIAKRRKICREVPDEAGTATVGL